jgi:serine kinase of HPr protein (carbohydrate metabolism regulator)
MIPTKLVHAGAITIYLGGQWRGILIGGASGTGKSDLALRAVRAGFQLVSDDYSEVFISSQNGKSRLFAVPAPHIDGRIEVRGLGIVNHAHRGQTPIDLIVHLQKKLPERMPQAEVTPVLGVNVPSIRLRAFEDSAVAKMLIALQQCL